MLIRRTKQDWQYGLHNGIGGRIEPGELPSNAMCREFVEETGIDTSSYQWHFVVRLYGRDWEVYVFRCFGSIPDHQMESEEGQIFSYDPRDLPRSLANAVEWLVPLCLYQFIGVSEFVDCRLGNVNVSVGE